MSSANYEISVSTGKNKVYYTNQFLNSVPYLFQFKNIFPYTNGIFVFIFSGFGLFYFFKNKKYKNGFWLLILIPTLVYFIYNGQLYTKWTRYMVPIFFIFPLLTAYFFDQFKNKIIKYLLVFISIIPGIIFLNLYMQSDIRVAASNWIIQNIPANTKILSEGGNVMELPVNNKSFEVKSFDFYNLENDPKLVSDLYTDIKNSDYIFVPSRRIFKNQANSKFPNSWHYYQNLFSGNLGFVKIKEFKPNFDFLLNSENAEETWSVFDHPVIRIYKHV